MDDGPRHAAAREGLARALYSSGELTGVDVRELRELLAETDSAKGAQAGAEAGAPPRRSGRGRRGVLVAARRVVVGLLSLAVFAGSTANAALRQRTEVRVAPADRTVGERIAAVLGGLPVTTDGMLGAGRAQVMLGADYAGPGLRSVTSSPAPPPPTATSAPAVEDVPITADGIPCVD